jgi:acyl carrier protein
MTVPHPESPFVERLTAILGDVLSHGIADLDGRDLVDDRFAVLGVNSVDYLEFILNLEHALSIDVPDEAMMDPALNSVRAWSTYLERHAGGLASNAA